MIKANAAFHAEPVFVLLGSLFLVSPCLLNCFESAIVALAKLGVGLMKSVMKPECRRQSCGGLCRLKIERSSHLKVLSVGKLRIYHFVIDRKVFQFFSNVVWYVCFMKKNTYRLCYSFVTGHTHTQITFTHPKPVCEARTSSRSPTSLSSRGFPTDWDHSCALPSPCAQPEPSSQSLRVLYAVLQSIRFL